MKRLTIYTRGFLIGMIAEYGFRIEFGYIQASILVLLIMGAILDIINTWHD